MNKQTIIIAVVSLLVIAGAIFGIRALGGSSKAEVGVEPTPSVTYIPVDDRVQASITPNAQKTKVTLIINGLDGRFTELEYEMSYETDNNGTQGAFSNDPIDVSNMEEFEREFELGSCSTGGKCSYDKGVRNFKLLVKFKGADGQSYILQDEFPTI